MWPDRRLLDLFATALPIIQAPMAGSNGSALAIAVSKAGGLGSLPCAMLSPEQARSELAKFRAATSAPVNVNFFCHAEPQPDIAREAAWRRRLEGYYAEFALTEADAVTAPARTPFDDAMCEVVEEFAPEVVSFHFGLPERRLLDRVRATGAKIISSATTVDEARWLQDNDCDAIIAQGYEAGGHRGMFRTETIATQAGLFALLPQIADAVKCPVIASGAIADGRGVAAAFALGASAVQIGTAYLFCPEATASPLHRAALRAAKDDSTTLTNLFSGRPARGIVNRLMREQGPISDVAPAFPLASAALAPLRAKAEKAGSGDFSPLWSGQAAALCRDMPAGELTQQIADEALAILTRLAPK
jgi:nitronate monooxygenase